MKGTFQHYCNVKEYNEYLLFSTCNLNAIDIIIVIFEWMFLCLIMFHRFFILSVFFLYVKGNTSWRETKAWVACAALGTENISSPCEESLLLSS